jgi:superfamily II DNA or RNA helicase
MATLLAIDDYTEPQLKEICKLLTIVLGSREEEKRAKYTFGKSKIPQKKKENIPVFQVDYIEGKPYLRVPFRFGCGFLGKLVNRDKEYPKIEYTFNGSLREYQISSYGTTTLALYTGCGKSILSAYLASLTRCVTLVMINMQPLIASWYNTFATCFPDKKNKIWIVGEGPMPLETEIIICMDQRIKQVESIKDKIGCYILDEAHTFGVPSKIESLLYLTPKYVIVCTATLERDDYGEQIIQTIERISQKPYKLFKVLTNIKIPEESGMHGLNYGAFVSEQSKCMERNLIAMNIINGNKVGHKFMIFTKLKSHVDDLSALCKHYGFEYDTLYGSKKKFEDKQVLIMSVSKGGTGLDISMALGDRFSGELPDTLILMSSMKSIPKLKQLIGRILRNDSPKVCYLVDKNNVVRKHFNEAKDMFIKNKANIIEVDYDPTIAGGGIVLGE